jgi:hypothetical protein
MSPPTLVAPTPKLVARNRDDYVDLALALARPSQSPAAAVRRPGRRRGLGGLRKALVRGRGSSALFDIDSYVRSYEALLAAAWDSLAAARDAPGPGPGDGGGLGLAGGDRGGEAWWAGTAREHVVVTRR